MSSVHHTVNFPALKVAGPQIGWHVHCAYDHFWSMKWSMKCRCGSSSKICWAMCGRRRVLMEDGSCVKFAKISLCQMYITLLIRSLYSGHEDMTIIQN